jgi:REP element-mobilizing transposase RayT
MSYEPAIHHRRSILLPGYDYAQAGGYYVTICAHYRRCLFGEVVAGRVRLGKLGEIVREEWLRACEVRPGVKPDAWVVMPNHVHGVVIVGAHGNAPLPLGRRWPEGERAHCCAPLRRPPRSLGALISGFKGAVTRRVARSLGSRSLPVWQRGYYEHVVRDDGDLEGIRQYIGENPKRWAEDRENPIHPWRRPVRVAEGDPAGRPYDWRR